LAELLLSDGADAVMVGAVAARAGWSLPGLAAVVLVSSDSEVARALLDRLGDSCLRLRRGQVLLSIVPGPAGRGWRHRLATALRGVAAVVGHAVPLHELPTSLRFAELAARLQQSRVLLDDPVFVDEHLDAILVHHDEMLLAAVRQRYLGPLARLPGATRDRLSETLRSWLMNMGNRSAVASELHVHPQTVRYRLARLRELFGSALDDPTTRAALLLALAWGPAITEADIPPTSSVPEQQQVRLPQQQRTQRYPAPFATGE
jgi:hypothetical protein